MDNNELNQTNLTAKQLKAIPVILATKTHAEAIRQLRIAKSTFYSWLKDEAFKDELQATRDLILSEAYSRLKSATSLAVDILIQLLKSEAEHIKLRTATEILNFADKVDRINDTRPEIVGFDFQIVTKKPNA